jgi:hypothetical protein
MAMTTSPDAGSPDPGPSDIGPTDPVDQPGPVLTYPDAPESLIDLWQRRRKRMAFGPDEGLPPLDVDLKALLATPITMPDPAPEKMSLHSQKLHAIRTELVGKPELAALNAILIAHLRKSSQARHAPALFRRIWTEEGPSLLPHLPGRWLISTVITFGDHGETEAQRRIGLAMNVLFSLMKLYEFERFHSAYPPERPFKIRSTRGKRLPVGMPNFALLGGGLDINLLAQLWHEATLEPVAGRVACHLLDLLNADPGNLFRRIGLMRDAKANPANATPPAEG